MTSRLRIHITGRSVRRRRARRGVRSRAVIGFLQSSAHSTMLFARELIRDMLIACAKTVGHLLGAVVAIAVIAPVLLKVTAALPF